MKVGAYHETYTTPKWLMFRLHEIRNKMCQDQHKSKKKRKTAKF